MFFPDSLYSDVFSFVTYLVQSVKTSLNLNIYPYKSEFITYHIYFISLFNSSLKSFKSSNIIISSLNRASIFCRIVDLLISTKIPMLPLSSNNLFSKSQKFFEATLSLCNNSIYSLFNFYI